MVELQNENRFDSEDTTLDSTNNLFSRIEVASELELNKYVEVEGAFTFEPMDQAATKNANDDIAFESEGAFVEELHLDIDLGAAELKAGKFNPQFGTAWDPGRGIWSEDFAEDYELTEKIGVGAEYEFDAAKMGTHTLSAATFYNDTSGLSRAVITERGPARISDGGAGNTEDLSSFVVSLDGENAFGVESLGYTLGARQQAEQDEPAAGVDDETGYVAGVSYTHPVNSNVVLDSKVEYATFDNYGGTADVDQEYYYASVVARLYENWNVTAGYTMRDISDASTVTTAEDHLFQLTGGYDFGNGLTAEAGYRGSNEANNETHIVGFLLRYQGEYSVIASK